MSSAALSVSESRRDSNAAVTAMLRPRSIAIVGASDRSRWSLTAFDNLTSCGFDGTLHLVNRNGGVVHGCAASHSCVGIGAAVDLGVILVPVHVTTDALRDLATAGARSAVVLTSGFAETGAEGAALQNGLSHLAASLGIRLLGPNSLGYINFADRAHVWTTPIRAPSRQDGVAIISQSGATAHFLATLAWQQDVGLSHVIATGNEVDMNATECARVLIDHDAARVIALFLETVRDPASFLAMAEAALVARKPLVVLKVGASEVTAKSALAHTGALIGDDRVFDGICRQFGIIRVHSIEDLLATADTAARTGSLRAGGLGIVSNSGGICEIAADSSASRAIALPSLTDRAAAALKAIIPGFATPPQSARPDRGNHPGTMRRRGRDRGGTTGPVGCAVPLLRGADPGRRHQRSPQRPACRIGHQPCGSADTGICGELYGNTPDRAVAQHRGRPAPALSRLRPRPGVDRLFGRDRLVRASSHQSESEHGCPACHSGAAAHRTQGAPVPGRLRRAGRADDAGGRRGGCGGGGVCRSGGHQDRFRRYRS